MLETEVQSYYEVLDVKPDASQNEIRQAYLRAKAAYSKDSAALYSLFDEHETRQVLENIEQAYLVLSNPEKRKEYDRVHGFINPGAYSMPNSKQPGASANVFSFATGTTMREEKDPAQVAAQNVFGTGANDDLATGRAPDAPAASRNEPARTSSSSYRTAGTDDYSTPRTLAAASSPGSGSQDYYPGSGNSSAFTPRENVLGIIRRTDLSRPYEKRPEMEEMIASETHFRGDFLRKVREYKCVTVDELSEFTKISKTYINCIEAEEYDSLPAPAYLRGFIIQIARALKLPADKVATGYMINYKNAVQK